MKINCKCGRGPVVDVYSAFKMCAQCEMENIESLANALGCNDEQEEKQDGTIF